jgi:hypothetical protein
MTDGMCMGTLVSDSIYKQIIGFHLGGKGKRGGAASFTIDTNITDSSIHLK